MNGFGFSKGFVRFIELLGWIAILSGVVVVVIALQERRPEALFAIAGLFIGSGMLSVLGAQMARAQIVTAESARAIHDLLKERFADPVPPGASSVYEEYRGVTIYRAGPGAFMADGLRFESLAAARQYADEKL